MSMLRPFSIFIRNALIKQHPYFSCCASCGEIKTPLGRRLCASLAPVFPVDAVIIAGQAGADTAGAARHTINSLKEHAPWLRAVYLLGNNLPSGLEEEGCALIPLSSLPSSSNGLAPAYHLFAHEALAECFLILDAGSAREKTIEILDLFTPNGIPLLPITAEAAPEHTEVTPQLFAALEARGLSPEPELTAPFTRIRAYCKATLKEFAAFAAPLSLPDPDSQRVAFVHFAYSSALVVPTLYHTGETPPEQPC